MQSQLTNQQLAIFFGCEAMVSIPKQTTERRMKIDEELLYDNFIQLRDYERSMVIKPILRPITDLKEMDIVAWAKIIQQEHRLNAEENDEIIKDVKKKGWKVFDGEMKIQQSILAIQWLISAQFDIYGWIEKGLALDKTKIKD